MKQAKLDQNGLATEAGVVRVYNVDPQTQEYVGASDEFLLIGVGIPQYSFLQPPFAARDGYAVCRQEDKWAYVTDLRGKICYNIINQEQQTITELGELPAGLTLQSPAGEFDKWDGQQWITDKLTQLQAKWAEVKRQKQFFNEQAKDEISRLNDSFELNLAVDGDQEKLLAWRKYRVLLGQLDLTQPDNLQWPQQPE